jgi:thiol peroxidase
VSADGKTEQNYFGMGVDSKTGKPWVASEKKVERPVTVTVRGKPVTLEGRSPEVGERAPEFRGVSADLTDWGFLPGTGQKVVILSAVPSLDTGTCSRETKRFNDEVERANAAGIEVEVITISMDLPFAQKRWCGAEGVKHVTMISDYKDRDFARNYGVRVKETGLLARAVWVVGKDGKILYREICSELANEPDYVKVMEAAKKGS